MHIKIVLAVQVGNAKIVFAEILAKQQKFEILKEVHSENVQHYNIIYLKMYLPNFG